MPADPIFIIGTERSGSNLLRLILNSHSGIAVPHPPHILRYFTPLVPRYGDLSQDACFRSLARDVLRLIRVHICPWEVPIDLESIVATADPRNLLGIHVACYEQYTRAVGKGRWACKSTFVIDHVDEILKLFPAGRLVYLVRDPRDVAVSSRWAVFNPYHPFFTARLWQEQQDTGAGLLDRLPPEQISLLRYEDLLHEPEGAVGALCEFLGESFEPGMLKFFETREAQQCSTLSRSWANTASPVKSGNAGRYRRELGDRELTLVETLTARGMQRFGYVKAQDTQAIQKLDPRRPRLYYRLADAAMSLRAEVYSLLRDRNHWRRWARAALLLWLKYGPHLRRNSRNAHGFSRPGERGS